MVDYTEQRKHMVQGHLQPSGVRDPVILKAVGQIHRENFLPASLKAMAYVDDDIALDPSHFLMRPNDLLRMMIALNISPSDNVLDIGCTTGYSSVILSFLGHKVIGLEATNTFIDEARRLAEFEGVSNVTFTTAPYSNGSVDNAPYDVILLQRAYTEVPQLLLDQLATAGRLVYIKQTSETFGQACLVEKHQGHISHKILFEMCVPYFNDNGTKGFSF